jgi:hypothetical protein
MNSDSEPIRNLNGLMIIGIRPGTHFHLIKIARSEAIVIYHHICLVLLYLYTCKLDRRVVFNCGE